MALLPTGSDKLLEIRTNKVNVVIKSKKKITVLPSNEARSSSLAINGYNIERVKIENQGIEELYQDTKGYSVQQLSVSPLFFEQTDYELYLFLHYFLNKQIMSLLSNLGIMNQFHSGMKIISCERK